MTKTLVEQKVPLVHPIGLKKAKNTESIEAMTPESDRKVKGQFVNVETPGQTFTVNARYYKGMEMFQKVFTDGEDLTIAILVARWY